MSGVWMLIEQCRLESKVFCSQRRIAELVSQKEAEIEKRHVTWGAENSN